MDHDNLEKTLRERAEGLESTAATHVRIRGCDRTEETISELRQAADEIEKLRAERDYLLDSLQEMDDARHTADEAADALLTAFRGWKRKREDHD